MKPLYIYNFIEYHFSSLPPDLLVSCKRYNIINFPFSIPSQNLKGLNFSLTGIGSFTGHVSDNENDGFNTNLGHLKNLSSPIINSSLFRYWLKLNVTAIVNVSDIKKRWRQFWYSFEVRYMCCNLHFVKRFPLFSEWEENKVTWNEQICGGF